VVFVAAVASTLEYFVAPVARALQEQGWETIGVSEDARSVEGFDRVYDLPPFRRRGVRAHLAAYRALCRILAREAPDVTQLHTPAAVALGRLAAARCSVPSISVVHGTFLESRVPGGALFALAEAPFAWISRRTVVVNGDDARFYRRLCRQGSVIQAPAGGAGVKVRLAGTSAPPVPTALYLGRLASDKNLDFLIDAWVEARRRVPDLQLRIVGEALEGDPPWVMPELAGLDHARWTDDPSAEIDQAAALVTASGREGFGMVVAEAVCAGIPVVAVENRGTREIARQVDTGLTMVPLDTRRFADALAAAVGHERRPRPDLRARWGVDATVAFHVGVIAECVGRRVERNGRTTDLPVRPEAT